MQSPYSKVFAKVRQVQQAKQKYAVFYDQGY
jgi:hypothetical protein